LKIAFIASLVIIVCQGANAPEMTAQAIGTTPTQNNQPVIRSLFESAPAPELKDKLQLFGQFGCL
jgi:hypothetical protein